MKFDNKFNVIYDKEEMNVPIKLWLSEVEDEALSQLHNLSTLPFAYHHIVALSDCHVGYGMPIGGVMASDGYIIPYAVGSDIGCGMISLKTSLFSGSLDKTMLKKIMRDIRKLIPVGFKRNKYPQGSMPEWKYHHPEHNIITEEFSNAKYQLGTLGGGNHFIEIQQGDDGHIYIMIHSGSRNLGLKVAKYYNKLATELNEKWYSKVSKHYKLAFLPFNDETGQCYFNEMNYCCDFALANRKLMMEKVKEAMSNHLNVNFYDEDMINIHHNYASLEHHFGKNVLVHRKGATRAYEGELGIIPGSQGSKSYIVKGKGNEESFKSCSHGAGRKMGRKAAQKKLIFKEEVEKLDNQGIIHSIRTKKDLDEASGAYKDIDEVMEHQKDLISIVTELKPLAVVKG